ncbi:hypothetical protein M0R45_030279 [Rubus argutus]|uniref:Uncharacterized protein n=1 Tax=Rubus argutus TaxID=59490 RepID=A0AAW1WCH8_RUBAR
MCGGVYNSARDAVNFSTRRACAHQLCHHDHRALLKSTASQGPPQPAPHLTVADRSRLAAAQVAPSSLTLTVAPSLLPSPLPSPVAQPHRHTGCLTSSFSPPPFFPCRRHCCLACAQAASAQFARTRAAQYPPSL